MATALFNSIGLSTTPDPNLYKNQKEVAGQMDEAKSDMKGTLASINLFSSALSIVPGIPADLTDSVDALKGKAETLVNSTTTSPDKLEEQRQQIEKDLAEIEAKKDEILQTNLIKELQDAADAVEKRYGEVSGDKTTSPELLKRYQDLLTDARKALTDAQRKLTVIQKRTEGFQTIPTPVGAAPTPLTAQEILDQLAALDEDKKTEEEKEFSWSRLMWRILGMMSTILLYTSVAFGALLGGIVLSNTYMDSGYWGTRLFYFFYGAAFFPAVMIYGLLKPPVWRSTIAPLYKIDGAATGTFDGLFGYTDTVDQIEAASNKTTMRILLGVTAAVLGLMGGFRFLKPLFTKSS
jgi:hypothetical protein